MIAACDGHIFGPDPDCDDCWGIERCENCDLPTGACVLIGCKAPLDPTSFGWMADEEDDRG